MSLAYTLIYLIKGSLPWAEYLMSSGGPDLQSLILCKVIYSPEGLPSVFCNFLSYVLDLRDSATYHNIDYTTQIEAFRTFCDLYEDNVPEFKHL